MEVLVVLFLLFLFSSLGDNKKKQQQKREAEQRAFRQMQEDMERQEAEAAKHMSADEGQRRATEMEREKQKELKQRLQQAQRERMAQQAAAQARVEPAEYRPPQPTVEQRAQVAFAHATEESSACTDDWAEEVRLHARPPRAQAPAAATYASQRKVNPYAALFTEQGLRNGVIVSEILGSRGGRHGRRIGR